MRHTPTDQFIPQSIAQRMADVLIATGDEGRIPALFAAGFTGREIVAHQDKAEAIARRLACPLITSTPENGTNLLAAVERTTSLMRAGSILADMAIPSPRYGRD